MAEPIVAFITLECNRGAHQECPGGAVYVGRVRPRGPEPWQQWIMKVMDQEALDQTQVCQCIHHREGVVLPEGFPGRT